MQSQVDTLEKLEHLLRRWDEDMRFGHRGVEQLTMFLQKVHRHIQGKVPGHEDHPAEDSNADRLRFHSREQVEMVIDPMTLAKFRQLATWYVLKAPLLLKLIDQCEASLHPDDVAGLIKREAAQVFPCGRL